MFPISEAARALLESGHYEVHTRVWVNPTFAEDNLDLSDRFLDGTISYSIDQPAATATLTFERGQGVDSLSPFLDASRFNHLGLIPPMHPGAYVVVFTSINPPGGASVSGFNPVFQGRVDAVNVAPGGDKVTIQCRDLAGHALNRWIEPGATNGKFYAAGMTLEALIELVMSENGFGAGWFQVDGATGFTTSGYWQSPMPVMDAIRTLAQTVGWDIRCFPGQVASGSFTLYDPDRTRTTPDAILAPSEYLDVTNLSLNDSDVRNLIELIYSDSGTRTVRSTADLAALASDLDASIAKYGRRFMRLVEGKTSQIDTEAEADRMLTAAFYDLSDPVADQQITLRHWWPVELNDLHHYTANGIHYDQDQRLAVVGYTHQLNPKQPRTIITARGRPMAASREWRAGQHERTYVSLDAPTGPAVEGAIWIQTDDLTPAA